MVDYCFKCGMRILKRYKHFKRYKKNIFCSRGCVEEYKISLNPPLRMLKKQGRVLSGDSYGKNARLNLMRKYNYRCTYCGSEENLSVDHVIPLSKGGEDYIENLVIACRKCNSSKGNKELNRWLKSKIIQKDISSRR